MTLRRTVGEVEGSESPSESGSQEKVEGEDMGTIGLDNSSGEICCKREQRDAAIAG